MPSSEQEIIDSIHEDICQYLDRLQRRRLLWADVDNHIAASHIAECVGDKALAARHLQTVTTLMAEIYLNYPVQTRSHKTRRPIILKPYRRYRIDRAPFGPERST